MTKKHYIALAATIRQMATDRTYDHLTLLEVVDRLAAVLVTDNPRFDRDKFRDACGLSVSRVV